MLRAAAKNFPQRHRRRRPGRLRAAARHAARRTTSRSRSDAASPQKAFQHVASYDTAISQYLRDPDDILPGLVHHRPQQALRHALRREPAPARRLLRRRERHEPEPGRHRLRRAAPRQGAVLQQHPGRRRRLDRRLRLPGADRRHRQAHEPLRPRHATTISPKPTGAPSPATPSPPSAASSPSTGASRWPSPRRSARRSTRSSSRPTTTTTALELLRKKRDLRILRAKPPSLAGLDYRRVVGGLLVQERDNIPDAQIEPKTVTKRAPDRRRDARPALRQSSASSTSSRTPSYS